MVNKNPVGGVYRRKKLVIKKGVGTLDVYLNAIAQKVQYINRRHQKEQKQLENNSLEEKKKKRNMPAGNKRLMSLYVWIDSAHRRLGGLLIHAPPFLYRLLLFFFFCVFVSLLRKKSEFSFEKHMQCTTVRINYIKMSLLLRFPEFG